MGSHPCTRVSLQIRTVIDPKTEMIFWCFCFYRSWRRTRTLHSFWTPHLGLRFLHSFLLCFLSVIVLWWFSSKPVELIYHHSLFIYFYPTVLEVWGNTHTHLHHLWVIAAAPPWHTCSFFCHSPDHGRVLWKHRLTLLCFRRETLCGPGVMAEPEPEPELDVPTFQFSRIMDVFLPQTQTTETEERGWSELPAQEDDGSPHRPQSDG